MLLLFEVCSAQFFIFLDKPAINNIKNKNHSNGIRIKNIKSFIFEYSSVSMSSLSFINAAGSALVPFSASGTEGSPAIKRYQ